MSCVVFSFLLRRRGRDEAAAMEYRGGGPEGEAQLLRASRVSQGWLHDLGSSSLFDDQHSLLFLFLLSMCLRWKREIRSLRPVVLGASNDGRVRALICPPLSHGSGFPGMMDGCTQMPDAFSDDGMDAGTRVRLGS